ncbi:hypothetical protein [Paenibacillus silviterrae]|uniref:hypothetical protein n=1 Tax=Paenibacillus silviterrae TaxID=3242194 RepID=UPI002543AB08|nr:hypothetical protein [Paenibacillus chinjuensis]
MTSQIEQPAMVIEPGRGRIEIYTTHVTTSKESSSALMPELREFAGPLLMK